MKFFGSALEFFTSGKVRNRTPGLRGGDLSLPGAYDAVLDDKCFQPLDHTVLLLFVVDRLEADGASGRGEFDCCVPPAVAAGVLHVWVGRQGIAQALGAGAL